MLFIRCSTFPIPKKRLRQAAFFTICEYLLIKSMLQWRKWSQMIRKWTKLTVESTKIWSIQIFSNVFLEYLILDLFFYHSFDVFSSFKSKIISFHFWMNIASKIDWYGLIKVLKFALIFLLHHFLLLFCSKKYNS